MSNSDDAWNDGVSPRKSSSLRGLTSSGGRPREEPFRNYAGWKCSHCGSGNTIIEGYPTGPEGYCMTCTREIPIPKEHLNAYNQSRKSR